MKVLGYITAFIALIVVSATMNGWALSILWEWYLVPIFDIPKISIPSAIGIALIVGYLTHQQQDVDTEDYSPAEVMTRAIIIAFTKPLLALLFGWVVLHWV